MILFSSPTPKTREGSSWVPVSGELHSLDTTEPTSCGRTLGNMHIKHTGKRRGTNRAGAGWSPAKNFEWYSYQNWNTTGGGQVYGLWGKAVGNGKSRTSMGTKLAPWQERGQPSCLQGQHPYVVRSEMPSYYTLPRRRAHTPSVD